MQLSELDLSAALLMKWLRVYFERVEGREGGTQSRGDGAGAG